MENYLRLQNAIDQLNQDTERRPAPPNTQAEIANLATYGELSPVVRYNGLISIDDSEPIIANCFITSHELIDLIDDSQSEITLENAIIYDGANSGLAKGQAVKLHSPKTYRQSNVLMPEGDIICQLFDDLTDPTTADKQLIARLLARIDELESELYKADEPNNQSDTPADGESIDKGQGDSLLILGAVLETLKEIKPNYTQQSHITAILEKYKSVNGISKSTLEKKFSQAKNYLKQSIN